MPETYLWRCGCQTTGVGEEAAKRHAVTCSLFGYPMPLKPRCTAPLGGDKRSLCGLPLPCREHQGAA